MRVISRIALTLLAVAILVQPTSAQPQQQANCPLTLTATNQPASSFALSPHGAFRSGNQVFVLRGQTLTTYAITDLGDLSIAREDLISTLVGRNAIGGVAFSNGYLFVSSEGGLEIYDLRNVRSGGNAPVFVSRVAGLNYRRLAVSGNTLAALFPATDVPCAPATNCPTFIDFYNISNLANPVRVSTLNSNQGAIGGFNDIAFNFGHLIVAGTVGTAALNVSNPALPASIGGVFTPGTFLVSNGTNLVAVGSDNAIVTYALSNPFTGFTALTYHSTATLQVGRANRIVFHPQAFIDDANNRLITIIDEIDPSRPNQSARSIAFDVFEYSIPMFEGRDPRVYETVSWLEGDEVKYNPIAAGPVVYVVGEMSGMQTYGACGQMAGKIETTNVAAMPCGGAEMHGWVTGTQRIERVEVFLDNTTTRTSTSLGLATVGGVPRTDIPSKTPVFTWRLSTLLDTTARGNYVLRAVGTDAVNNRRQFASQPIFFPGPGQNCFNRRRTTGR